MEEDIRWEDFERVCNFERGRIMRIMNPRKRAEEAEKLNNWIKNEAAGLGFLQKINTKG